MDALYMLEKRRSVRAYKEEQVPEELLNAVLKAGTYAPTGNNKQSPTIVVVRDAELIKKLSRMNAAVMGKDGDPFYGAPTVIIVFGNPVLARTWFEDACLVMGNLMNAAYAEGLGSCWVHRAKEMFETEEGKALMKEWGVPETCIGIGHCILGYAKNPEQDAPPRREDYVIRIG